MVGVATLLAAAAAAHLLARWWRLPPLPLMVLAGIAVSLAAPVPADVLQDALVLGVSFLLFLAGLELDPRRLGAQRAAALRVGVAQFGVLALLGFGASALLGFGLVEAAYLALALTASSTLVGVRLLRRRRQMFEPFGRLVLGVLLVQDVLVLLAIPALARVEAGWMPALERLAAIAALGVASLALHRWLAPLLQRADEEQEMILLAPLAVLFAFLWATHLLELPLVVGAFLAGVALSRFPVRSMVQHELTPVGDFFAALFFTALGALVQVPTGQELWQAAVLAGLVIAVTPPLVALVGEWNGLSARSALEAGLMLSQTSEISLVVGLTGLVQGHLGGGAFTVIALVTMVTMLLTPMISTDGMAWRLVHLHPFHGRRIPGLPPSSDVVLLGSGSTGKTILEALLTAGAEVTVVEDDPAVCGELQQAGVRVVRGDGSDPAVLADAGVARARLVLSTLRRVRDNATVLALAPEGVAVVVRVFDEREAAWVRERGGEPVVTSRLAVGPLLDWYEEHREALDRSVAARAG